MSLSKDSAMLILVHTVHLFSHSLALSNTSCIGLASFLVDKPSNVSISTADILYQQIIYLVSDLQSL